MTDQIVLTNYLNQLLDIKRIKDYAPNGLQIEGKSTIQKIVGSVSASLDAVEFAIAQKADVLLVHHGYFWKNEPAMITGVKKQRIARLLANEINLYGYHLPLDIHPRLGNSIQLANLLGINNMQPLIDEPHIFMGTISPSSIAEFAVTVESKLARTPLVIGDPKKSITKIALCTGAAQGYFLQAVEAGAELYITGEISEHTVHFARESGVAFMAAGHHATERYGVQALGKHLVEKFGVEYVFFDAENPV